MLTAERIHQLRQEIKHGIDWLEANHPGPDVTDLHDTLADADRELEAVVQRVFGTGVQPLDGTPKT